MNRTRLLDRGQHLKAKVYSIHSQDWGPGGPRGAILQFWLNLVHLKTIDQLERGCINQTVESTPTHLGLEEVPICPSHVFFQGL